MEGFASSTIAVLCFKNRIDLEFHALTSDLADALWASRHGGVNIQAQYEDFVIFDLPAGRICLAHTNCQHEFPDAKEAGPFAECLVVTIGSSPSAPWGGPLFNKRAEVRDELVARIGAQYEPDEVLLLERDEVFSEAAYDALIEQVWEMSHKAAKPEKAGAEALPEFEMVGAAPEARPPRKTALDPLLPDDYLPGLTARFDAECQRRETRRTARYSLRDVRSARPAPARAAAPDHLPEPPAAPQTPREAETEAKTSESSRLRRALYPDGPIWDEDVYTQPLVHRAAIHAMNTAVMAVSLPVGAALLTLAVFGRESLLVTSRTTAITGVVMSLPHGNAVIESLKHLI